MSTSRAGFRFFARNLNSSSSHSQQPFQFKQFNNIFRRRQTTVAGVAGVEGAPAQQSFFQRIWTSEVGIKTVHFWAPVMKWGVVIAGASDFMRPAEKLSITQNLALMGTGAIWTRWCFVIRPKNVLLAAVNFCLFIVGTTQVTRIWLYQRSLEADKSGTDAVKSMAGEVAGQGKQLEKKAEAAV